MDWVSIVSSALAAVLGALGGGGIFYIRETKKDKQLDIELKEADAWKALYEEMKAKSETKSETIRNLYAERDANKESEVLKDKEIAKRDMEIERLKWYRCINNGCLNRRPKRNYDSEAETNEDNESNQN